MLTEQLNGRDALIQEVDRMKSEYNNLQNKYRELMEQPTTSPEQEQLRQQELERIKNEYNTLKIQYDTKQQELASAPATTPATIESTVSVQPASAQSVAQPTVAPTSVQLTTDVTVVAPEQKKDEPGFLQKIWERVVPKQEEEPEEATKVADEITEEAVEETPEIDLATVQMTSPTPAVSTEEVLASVTPSIESIPTVLPTAITEQPEKQVIYKYRRCKSKSKKKSKRKSSKKKSLKKRTSPKVVEKQPIIYIQSDGLKISKGSITFPRKTKVSSKTDKKRKSSKSRKTCSKLKELTN
jgi:hypothetical protein